ncbi:MAG: hypothetical protein NW701_13465 [Nitrospira sp.]
MADQRTPSDQGTGGKDPEDYPHNMGPVPVGKAPVTAEQESDEALLGIGPRLTPVEKRERTKDQARAAVAPEQSQEPGKRGDGAEPQDENHSST